MYLLPIISKTMNMTVRERLDEYREARHWNVSQFEMYGGLTPSLWRKTKSVSADVASRLLMSFPDLSAEWVMRGKGNMILESTATAPKVNITEDGYKAQIALYERMLSDKDAIIKALLNRQPSAL